MKFKLSIKKDRTVILILALLFVLIAIPRIRFPDLDHGDEYSDANILSAGQNFVRFGFIRCRFLPMFEVNLPAPRNLYTHVPPLPDIINGTLRMLFRTDSLYFFRMFALLIAFLNALFWYLFIRKFSNSRLIGLLAGLFYISNSMYIFCIDALHQPSYADFLRPVIFLFYFKLVTAKKREPRMFFLVWFLYLIHSLLTFEYIIYMALFFVLVPLLFKKTKGAYLSKRLIFILMLAPLCGFLLHFLQNAWYFGSPSLALADLKGAAIERIMHSNDSSFRNLNFSVWWDHAIIRNLSLAFIFNAYFIFSFLFVAFLFFINLSKEAKAKIIPLILLCIILIVCGLSWYVVFPAHSVAHAFLNFLARHLVPAASLAFAIFAYIVLRFIKEKYPRSLPGVGAFVFLVIIIISTGILKSELPVTARNLNNAKDFLVFKQCMLRLRSISKEQDRVGLNYFRFPFIRYYTNRNCDVVFEKAALEALSALPRYFIFLPYRDPRNLELFAYIREHYNPIFQCNSARFPSVFCELKQDAPKAKEADKVIQEKK